MKLNFPKALFITVLFSFISAAITAQVNPQALVDQQCPCNGPIAGGSWPNHGQYMKCVTDAVNDLKKLKKISPAQGGIIVSNAAQSDCGKEGSNIDPEELDEDSQGVLDISGVNEKTFNPQAVKISFKVSNVLLSQVLASQAIDLNNTAIHPADLNLTTTGLDFSINFQSGLNNLSVYLTDSAGKLLEHHYRLWAGAGSLQVKVVDVNGNPVSAGTVKVALSDDSTVAQTNSLTGASTIIPNLPSRTIIATASAPGNLFGSTALVASNNTIIIKAQPINTPSSINNNDFSLGLNGWNTANSPVSLVLHKESSAGAKISAPNSNAFTAADNVDLRLSTVGTSPQSVSRTFITQPGTKNVTVRYRFITSEVPGGYFGSQFNDYYAVSVRSQGGAGIRSDENSMNGLGLAAFNFVEGTTTWKELSLPVNQAGDIIQVDAVVSNVGDGAFQSQVEIDYVGEQDLSIEIAELIDPDKVNLLQYLSLDNHTYNGGKMPVYGRLLLQGSPGDKLTSLNLEISKGGTVLSTVNLDAGAQATLFQPFPSTGEIQLNSISLLYEIPSMAPQAQNDKVLVKLIATTENGETVSKEMGSYKNLKLFRGTNRYGTRDNSLTIGGDDWAQPATIDFCNLLNSTWLLNDLSNMNGNEFKPHKTHRDGNDMDVYFTGYNARDAAVANTLIDFLNSTLGAQVAKIFVTYTMTPTNVFYTAIKDKTLNDGRKVLDIIRPVSNHDTHFHILVNEASNPSSLKQAGQEIFMQRSPDAPADLPLAIKANVKIYPNPSTGKIIVSSSTNNDKLPGFKNSGFTKIIVYDKTGNARKIFQYPGGANYTVLDLGQLSTGAYMVEIYKGGNKQTIPLSINR